MKRKMKRNNLDEMQEQELLKIEHNGCWLAFWGLLAALIIQGIVYGTLDFRTFAGEWIVFMALSLYLAIACIRKGIWDRHIPMTTKANLSCSGFAAFVVGVFNAIVIYRRCQKPVGTAAAALFIAGITFGLCFMMLEIMMKQARKKIAKMEEEPSDANEM